jgi:hypothetical protein
LWREGVEGSVRGIVLEGWVILRRCAFCHARKSELRIDESSDYTLMRRSRVSLEMELTELLDVMYISCVRKTISCSCVIQ